jgi:hypothetical protein
MARERETWKNGDKRNPSAKERRREIFLEISRTMDGAENTSRGQNPCGARNAPESILKKIPALEFPVT